MLDQTTSVNDLKTKIATFVTERDWEQFHSPKNLSMSIAIEAAELMEHFQWLTIQQSKDVLNDAGKRKQVEDEVADIGAYLLGLCNVMGIDFSAALESKIQKNSKKYPVNKSKGSAKKYTDL